MPITLVKLKLIDKPILNTITFKSIINTPKSLFAKPPRSKLMDVKKKSLTTLSGRTNEKIFPKTPPKIAPINSDKTIIFSLRFFIINLYKIYYYLILKLLGLTLTNHKKVLAKI